MCNLTIGIIEHRNVNWTIFSSLWRFRGGRFTEQITRIFLKVGAGRVELRGVEDFFAPHTTVLFLLEQPRPLELRARGDFFCFFYFQLS